MIESAAVNRVECEGSFPCRSSLWRNQVSEATAFALSRTRLPVLLVGETGTGKSTLSREIHDSLSSGAPFVEVNAAAVGASLFLSEMFGHERGSFTGAHSNKEGLVEAARSGTLFLDEVADLSPECQAHLLCFLDTGRYRAVGGVRTLSSDARIISATNQNLEEAVRLGRFREDLYYRIASVVISVLPLRERRSELPELASDLLAQAAARHGVPSPTLAASALRMILELEWPGNVRQLKSVMEILAATWPGCTVEADHLRELVLKTPLRRESPVPRRVRPLAEVEREMVELALAQTGGNRTKAAELLGITPRGLYNKLRRYDKHHAPSSGNVPSAL